MTKTITGAEFNAFYDTGWPEGFYHEDSEYEIEDDSGKRLIKPQDTLELSRLGWIIHSQTSSQMTFTEAYEAWIAEAKPDQILVLQIPAERLEAVVAALRDLGVTPVGYKPDAEQPEI